VSERPDPCRFNDPTSRVLCRHNIKGIRAYAYGSFAVIVLDYVIEMIKDNRVVKLSDAKKLFADLGKAMFAVDKDLACEIIEELLKTLKETVKPEYAEKIIID